MDQPTVEQEVLRILEEAFPGGIPPSRVNAAVKRGDAKAIPDEVSSPPPQSALQGR